MLRDFLAGLSQLRLPLRFRIVLVLASAEADQHPVYSSHRDLAMVLGLAHQRMLRDALDELVETRVIERVREGGSVPDCYKLRPPAEWIEVPWSTERRVGLASVAYLRDCRARQKAVSAPGIPGALGAFARRPGRRGKWRLRAGQDGALNGADRAGQDGALTGAPYLFTREEESSLSAEASERSARLRGAIAAATGVEPWRRSGPGREVDYIASECNGRFDELLAAAGDPSRGPAFMVERVAWLADLMLSAPQGAPVSRYRPVQEVLEAIDPGEIDPEVGRRAIEELRRRRGSTADEQGSDTIEA